MSGRLASLAAALAFVTTAAAAASPPAPVGAWLTPDGAGVIDIQHCGPALCGRIAGVELAHPGDPMPNDWRGNPQCGMRIIRDAMPTQDGWEGEIVDPRDGTRYHARLRLDDNGQLKLRGYVLMPLFGQTQTWTRYDGSLPTDCRLSTQRAAAHGSQSRG